MICKPTSALSKGFGLVELMISSGLLFLLIVLVGALHLTGHKAYTKTSVSQEVTGEGNLFTRLLGSELQSSAFLSVTIETDGTAISFLSSKRSDGTTLYNSLGTQIWDHWVIFYLQGEVLRRRELPWGEGPTVREIPTTIEAATGLPLTGYLNGEGRILSRQVKAFLVEVPTGTELIGYRLELQSRVDSKHSLELQGKVHPRN